jgi:UDP-glucose 4-epimerase
MVSTKNKVLVTGGAGFIGSHLVHLLSVRGDAVTVVDGNPARAFSPFPEGTRVVQMRLPDPGFVEMVKREKYNWLFHLAGTAYVPPSIENPVADLNANAGVTVHVLETMARFSPSTKVVYTSSAAVYGNPETLPITEGHPTLPISPYGVSKLASEKYTTVYHHVHKMKTAALRLFSVFGPGQAKQVIFDLAGKILRHPARVEVYGTGQETRDFVYVGDVVSALVHVMENGSLQGEIYNVASGVSVSIKTLATTIARVLGADPSFEFTGVVRPGDVLRWEADIHRLLSIGWRPQTSLEDGLQQTLSWYKNNQDLTVLSTPFKT